MMNKNYFEGCTTNEGKVEKMNVEKLIKDIEECKTADEVEALLWSNNWHNTARDIMTYDEQPFYGFRRSGHLGRDENNMLVTATIHKGFDRARSSVAEYEADIRDGSKPTQTVVTIDCGVHRMLIKKF